MHRKDKLSKGIGNQVALSHMLGIGFAPAPRRTCIRELTPQAHGKAQTPTQVTFTLHDTPQCPWTTVGTLALGLRLVILAEHSAWGQVLSIACSWLRHPWFQS